MPSYDHERTIAFLAVQAAAELCQSVRAESRQPSGNVLEKEDRTPVTVADFGSQALICQALQSAFPDDPVIGEEDSSALRTNGNADVRDQLLDEVRVHHPHADAETIFDWIDHGTAQSYSDRFWTLDPIDGTKGFVRGDQYAIALALVVEGQLQVAALCCPHLPNSLDVDSSRQPSGQAFLAVRGDGAVQKPLHTDEEASPTPISTSDTTDATQSRFTESFVSSHSSHDLAVAVGDRLGITTDPIRIDSQAKYAIVARGEAEIYLRLPRPGTGYTERIWDHAAGSLVVEAAGGTVTDIHGTPLDFTHGHLLEQNTGIVATNGPLHDEVIDALQHATKE